MFSPDSIRFQGCRKPFFVVSIVYAVFVAALLPMPILGLVHAESSAAVAVVAFFTSGAAAVACFRAGARFWNVLAVGIFATVVPLVLYTVSLLWRANCGYVLGVALYVTFVLPSATLAVSLAYWTTNRTRWSRSWFVVVGLTVLVASVIFDLGLHPQFFTYSHIFGGVLGPVYDEELSVRPGLFAFRAITLIWSVLLFADVEVRRTATAQLAQRFRHLRLGALLTIGALYLIGGRLGINTTYRSIEALLDQSEITDHFVTHYASSVLSPQEVAEIAVRQEFRYQQLTEDLQLDVPVRIHVYLYPNADSKGRITGSRTTSITPVWLVRPQIHMLAAQHVRSFSHELVHVFSREFGMPVIRASPSIGLLEGLATALEAPDGLPSVNDQVAAAYQDSSDPIEELALAAVNTMSPVGFWSGRGPVSYSVAGSFVSYLLDALGVDTFKDFYRSARLPSASGGIDALARAWAENLLRGATPTPAARDLASFRFSQPSLFEERCPHYVSREQRSFRTAALLLADHDTSSAEAVLRESRSDSPGITYLRSVIKIARGDVPAMEHVADDSSRHFSMRLAKADAAVLTGRDATGIYDSLLNAAPNYARGARSRLLVGRMSLGVPQSIRLLYTASESTCRGGRSPAAFWSCSKYHAELKNFSKAAEVLQQFGLALRDSAETAVELRAFVAQEEGDLWLLSAEPDKAEAAYQAALSTPYVRAREELVRLLDDKLEFVRFYRDNKTTSVGVLR